MYLTSIAGLFLIVTALRYAVAPDAGRALVVRRLSLLTFLAGCLGFTAGAIKTLLFASALPPPDLVATVATGLGESLHNIGLALSCLVLAGIATTIGAARRGAKDGDELVAP